MFQYAAHYLFNPTGWVFHKAFLALGHAPRGYETVQSMNALFGVAAVAVMFALLWRMTRDVFAALPLALLAAHSFLFWSRAVECSVYMPALFWIAVALAAAWGYVRSGTKAALFGLAGACGLAVLYHLSHLFLAPAFFLVVLAKRRRDLPVFAAAWALIAGLPHVLTYRIYSLGALMKWYEGQGTGTAAAWGSGVNCNWGWGFSLPAHANALFQSLWVWPPQEGSWIPAFGFVMAAAGLIAVVWDFARRKLWKTDRDDRPLVHCLAAFVFGIFVFQSFWARELNKYSPLILAFVAFAGLMLKRRGDNGPSSLARVALWVLWLGTFVYNGWAGILPQSLPENNPALMRAFSIMRRTEPGSTIVVSGIECGFDKLYLPGFAKRQRIPLDLYLIGQPKEEAFRRVKADILHLLRMGTPVYVLSEVTEGRFISGTPENWRLTQA
ncbi:MAG: hypothetical protein HY548_03965, partial [Elusimicrobia bacterium]|nr:hypothetical protein [Elusimicrobiota bacterium]